MSGCLAKNSNRPSQATSKRAGFSCSSYRRRRGEKGKAFRCPLPQLQFARAQAASAPILQWCEALPQAGVITDPGHEALFNTTSIHATNLVSFEGLVLEELKKLSRASTEARKTGKRTVFVDDVLIDESLRERIRVIIKRASSAKVGKSAIYRSTFRSKPTVRSPRRLRHSECAKAD